MSVRSNSDIVKGNQLQVFIGNDPIAFATSCTLTVTTNTTQIATKDHGEYPSTLPQSITWEITADNLYAGDANLLTSQKEMSTVNVKFAPVSNYDSKGLVGTDHANWTAGNAIVSGDAYITSISINAATGDNATYSVTFTGAGPLS